MISALLLLLGACQKPESPQDPVPVPTPTPPSPTTTIMVSEDSQSLFENGITFGTGEESSNPGDPISGGGSDPGNNEDTTPQPQVETVAFTASAAWSASAEATKAVSWLSLEPSSGGAGDVSMKVIAQANETYEDRSATVTIKCGDSSASFVVKQAGKPSPIAVSSITLDRDELILTEGESITLIAKVEPDNSTDKTVVWSSSNVDVATVTESGMVTAHKEGVATIMATAGEHIATCSVSVRSQYVPVSSIVLNKTELCLTKGQTETLITTIAPENATNKTVHWSSSDATIASVTQDGRISALKSGVATITAKAGDVTAICRVTINTPVESVFLSYSSISLKEGTTFNLIATISPNDADEQTKRWSSSNTLVATVDDGLVTAVSEGLAMITVEVGDQSATCSVIVKKEDIIPVTSIVINKTSLSLIKGQSETLFATVNPDNATNQIVTWTSSDATVASITQDGCVTANKSGQVVISAYAGEQSASCRVIVKTPVECVTLDRVSMTLSEGQITRLIATISPNDADEQLVMWNSSNSQVAEVIDDGIITALNEGNAIITARVGDKTATCSVVVKKDVVPVSSILLNKTSLSLIKGQSEVLLAKVNPDNATDKTVSWSSSDETIASVSQNGRVTALKSGRTFVTAKAGEESCSCLVSITTPVESVTLDRTSITIVSGTATVLVATIHPNDADVRRVEWSSSNAQIATVRNGIVDAIAEGNAVITARVGDKSATCSVTVTKRVVAVYDVQITPSMLSMVKGQSERLSAIVSPSDATDKTVTWSTSDATIASVSQDGYVTALKSGYATIRARAGDRSATCAVSIRTLVESVGLNHSSVDLEVGQTFSLVATVNPDDADEKNVYWSCSNTNVATVANGVITAIDEGVATITARVENTSGGGPKFATCLVTVKKVPVTSVILNRTSLSLNRGNGFYLSADIMPVNATNKHITWSSSDEMVAQVDSFGDVLAIKSGDATITATVDGVSSSCEVTVRTPVEYLYLSQSSYNLQIGESYTLVAQISPSDADDQIIEWSSSNNSVATVAEGVVSARSAGTATITARAGSQSKSCYISVYSRPVTNIALNKTSLSLVEGESETLSATVSPNNATDKSVTWISTNSSIAAVNNQGMVTAVGNGSAEIIARAGSLEAVCNVVVAPAQFGVTGPVGDLPSGEICQVIEVTSNTAWTLSISTDWIVPSIVSGNAGVTSVTLNVLANNSSDSRNAVLTFSYGASIFVHTIIQRGAYDDLPVFSGTIVDWENESVDYNKK